MNANDTDSFDFAAFFKSELTIPWSHCRTSSLKAASERAIVVLSEKSYAGNFLTGKHVVACECSWHTELRSNSQRNGAAATTDRSTIARHIENTFPRQKFQTTIPKSFRLSSSKAITIFDFHAQYSEKNRLDCAISQYSGQIDEAEETASVRISIDYRKNNPSTLLNRLRK